jgi:hypothetical protein
MFTRFLVFSALVMILLGGLAVFTQKNINPVVTPVEAPAEPVFAEIADAPSAAPTQVPANEIAPPEPSITPRNLNQPMASSRQQILDKLISYSPPRLPGPGERIDKEVNALYRGFYEAAPGKFRRIQLARGAHFEVQIETLEQRFKKWEDETGDLIVENLEGDPYSLAITFPDRRVFYTKYFAEQDLPTFNGSKWRVLKGWLVSPGGLVAQRLALIDGTMPELEDLHERRKFVWPPLGVIQNLLPGELP